MENGSRYGKVAVLMGGRSAEREVSLMSGQGVLSALRARGVDAHAFDPAERPMDDLQREKFTRCFVALHGRWGEDGTVQGALELLGIPYTGAGVMASAIGIDKVMTKRVWLAEGLPVPRHALLRRGAITPETLHDIPAGLGLPLIVKPVREGSSLGMTKVTDAARLSSAALAAAEYDAEVLCEEFIDGQEVFCAVLGNGLDAQALPIVRISAPAESGYNYQNKYFTNVVKYYCPSGLSEAIEQEIRRITLAAYRALGCRGWGRADLMIRARDDQPFLLEMNTSPGMTSHSLVPQAAQAAGIGYEDLCLRLLDLAALDYGRPQA